MLIIPPTPENKVSKQHLFERLAHRFLPDVTGRARLIRTRLIRSST